MTALRTHEGKLLTQPEAIEDEVFAHFSKKVQSQRPTLGPLRKDTHKNDSLPLVDDFAALAFNGEISRI